MTNTEMLYEFRLGADVIASGAAPGFTDTQVYALLNRSQDYIIKDLYNEKNYLLLEEIVTTDSVAATYTGSNKVYYRALPADYWLYIDSYSSLTRTAMSATGFIPTQFISSAQPLKNFVVSRDKATEILSSVFNSSRIFKNPKCYIEDNKLTVLGDDYTTITNISLIYVKKRTDISSINNCELQESLHRRIVDKAIDISKVVFNIQETQSSN